MDTQTLLLLLAVGIVVLLLRSFLPAYAGEKGRNLATKEDIAAITKEVEGVKEEYGKRLEEFRFELKTREQAARIAEFLAEATGGGPDLSPGMAKKLNRCAWELSLWLPADTVRELTRSMVWAEGHKSVPELLILVRKHILNAPDDDLKAESIVHFRPHTGSA